MVVLGGKIAMIFGLGLFWFGGLNLMLHGVGLRVMGVAELDLVKLPIISLFLSIYRLPKFPFNFKPKIPIGPFSKPFSAATLGMQYSLSPSCLVSPFVDPRGMFAMLGNSP